MPDSYRRRPQLEALYEKAPAEAHAIEDLCKAVLIGRGALLISNNDRLMEYVTRSITPWIEIVNTDSLRGKQLPGARDERKRRG